MSFEKIKEIILDQKIFKIYKLSERLQQRFRCIFKDLKMASWIRDSKRNFSISQINTEAYQVGQRFSLREILSKPESFLSDKIFEIVNDQYISNNNQENENSNIIKRFKYV